MSNSRRKNRNKIKNKKNKGQTQIYKKNVTWGFVPKLHFLFFLGQVLLWLDFYKVLM